MSKPIPAATLESIEKSPTDYANSVPIKELVKILRASSDAYYNTGENIISDQAYDAMKEVLEERDPENKFLRGFGRIIIHFAGAVIRHGVAEFFCRIRKAGHNIGVAAIIRTDRCWLGPDAAAVALRVHIHPIGEAIRRHRHQRLHPDALRA